MAQEPNRDEASISVENIGGIDHCEVAFEPGISILTGRNATNRTSLLTAIAGVLGGSTTRLKSDADEGYVKLDLDGETYHRHYERDNSSVSSDGRPYTDSETLIDSFASLLEVNPARQAVERGDELRDVIMRPVDTDAIQQSIHRLEDERTELNTRIKEISEEEERLPSLKNRRKTLREELDAVDEEIEKVRTAVDKRDFDPEEADAAEEALAELDELRQKARRQEATVTTHRETLDALQEERAELESELESLSEHEETLEEIAAELNTLQGRERTLEDVINELSTVVEFNHDIVSDEESPLSEVVGADDPTAKLDVRGEELTCWTCGTVVERREIDDRTGELRGIVEDKRAERRELRERITDLRERRDELQSESKRRTEVERELREVRSDIERRERQLDRDQESLTDLRERIEAQQNRVEATEEIRDSDLLQQYEDLSDLEYERGQLEQELEEVSDEIERLDGLSEEREQLEAQREEVQTELEAQRTRVRDLEREAIDAFNERMEELLDLLRYENIERVWIERKEGAEFDSRRGGYRGDSVTRFDLHVVRTTEEGSVYEDTVATLSESEREVIGLVVALAGHLVHRMYETVPFMLLDSLEAIDSERIARLVEYFAEDVEYLIVALLPEDAATLDDEFTRVPASALSS